MKLLLLACGAAGLGVNLNPVRKVVKMLQAMSDEIEKEMKADQKIHEDFQCWCTVNRKEKTAAIETNEEVVKDNKALVEKLTGDLAAAKVKAESLQKELDADIKTLKETEAQRKKDGEAAHKMQTETTKAIQQLKGAIEILRKHNSMLSVSDRESVKALLEKAAQLRPDVSEEVPQAMSFLQGTESEGGASGEIFGILNAMLDQMSSDLSEGQQAEADAVAKFQEVRKAKRAEIKEGRNELEKTNEAIGTMEQNLIRARKDIAEAEEALDADRTFLADLEKKCAKDLKEHGEKVKNQNEEMTAVAETIEILNEDGAREHMTKALKKPDVGVFVQLSSRDLLVQSLDATAKKWAQSSPELALIASSAKQDPFAQIKKMIAGLIQELKKKIADEVKQKDYCENTGNKQAEDKDQLTFELQDLDTKRTEITGTIEKITSTLNDLYAQEHELQMDLAKATKLRQEQNAAYQTTFTDADITVAILEKAAKRMRKFYAAKQAFLQASGMSAKNQKAGGVLMLLDKIIGEARTQKAEAIQMEKDQQSDYEKFVGDSVVSLDDCRKATASNLADRANAVSERSDTLADMKSTMGELDALTAEMKALKKECQFLLDNFAMRQDSMQKEVEALQGAVAIFDGAQ